MKKNILILILMALGAVANAQFTIYDGDNVNPWDFNIMYMPENADTLLWNVQNPDMVGNTSDSVAMFVRGTTAGGGDEWGKQIRFTMPCDTTWEVADIIPSDSTAGGFGAVTMQMDVWTTADSAVTARSNYFEVSFSGSPTWPATRHATLLGKTTKTRQWETITFPFVDLTAITQGQAGTLPAADGVPLLFITFGHGSINAVPDTFYFDNLITIGAIAGTNSVYCIPDTTNDTMAIGHLKNSLKIELFPNPTNDIININFDALEGGKTSIEVVDNLGRLVINKDAGYHASGKVASGIDCASIPKGVYFVRVKHSDEIVVQKLIKN